MTATSIVLGDDARAVSSALARISGTDAIALVSLPASSHPIERLLALEGDAVLWAPREGARWAGVGVVAEATARGPNRFAELVEGGRAIFARSVEFGPARVTARLTGGLAFEPGAADDDPWQELGDARFVLPRVTYERDGERSVLTVAVLATDDVASITALLGRARAVLRADAAPDPTRVTRISTGSAREWAARVEAIRRAIHAGFARKVVAARSARVELDRAPTLGSVIRRLTVSALDCTTFAMRVGGTSFFAATPERLVHRRGSEVLTEALAGTTEADAGRLLASRKDRHEHDLVVRAIVDALTPISTSVDVATEPSVRTLRHVMHLSTPIRAELARSTHVLRVADRLHPTPAVAGVPRDVAVAWIRTHEPRARGWYAGPVGWFDASGNGELAVALRSAAIRGSHAIAFAGSGIVGDSEPESELLESDLKLRAALGALGMLS